MPKSKLELYMIMRHSVIEVDESGTSALMYLFPWRLNLNRIRKEKTCGLLHYNEFIDGWG